VSGTIIVSITGLFAIKGILAVEDITEPVRNAESVVQRKEYGELVGRLWLNILPGAGQPPGRPDTGLRLGGRWHRLRWSVMQEAAEGLAAKILVVTGKQNKFMPRHVRGLRWHGDHPPAGDIAQVEILPQSVDHLSGLLCGQVWIVFDHPGGNGGREAKAVDQPLSPGNH